MKKIVLISLAFSLWASGVESLKLKAQLLDLLATFLNNGHKGALIYIDDPKYNGIINFLKQSYLLDNCENAQIIFTKRYEDLDPQCRNKKIFFLSFKEYRLHKNKAVGAFFWQKGRPNILFRKEALQKFHIKVTPEFEKFVE